MWSQRGVSVGALLLLLLVTVASAQTSDYHFVVLSDIHIGESVPIYNGEELYSNVYAKAAIKKINELAPTFNIRFALITGDLTDSAENREYAVCRDVLDLLTVPYFPILGNHDVWYYDNYNTSDTPTGDMTFENVFATKFVNPVAPGVEVIFKAPSTFNPQFNITSMFQNYVVQTDGNGLALVVLDWNTRKSPYRPEYVDRGVGPWAELHDFPGGTVDWLARTLPQLAARGVSQVVFLQHHPYRLQIYAPDIIYGFDRKEKARIQEILRASMPLDKYHGVIAGHLHRFFVGTAFDEPGFENFGQW